MKAKGNAPLDVMEQLLQDAFYETDNVNILLEDAAHALVLDKHLKAFKRLQDTVGAIDDLRARVVRTLMDLYGPQEDDP
jgi:hypothetical protein